MPATPAPAAPAPDGGGRAAVLGRLEQVLADEVPGVQLVQVELAELRRQVLLQVSPGAFSYPADITQRPARLGRHFRQLVGAEHD